MLTWTSTQAQGRLFFPSIWIEGAIGCGKTTFSREVGRRLGYRVIEEPVDGNPYLEPFYSEERRRDEERASGVEHPAPNRHAFGMQMFLLHVRYMMQRLASDEATGLGGYKGSILDRSLAGDRVFAAMHHEAGNISDLDWSTYEMAYNFMARSLLPPTVLVFLDVHPETAYARMKKRARGAEVGVSIEYLTALREGYLHLLREAETGLMPWAHAIRVYRFCWEPDTVTEESWDRVARSIADMAGSIR